MLDKIFELI